jgi:hypothetical protein
MILQIKPGSGPVLVMTGDAGVTWCVTPAWAGRQEETSGQQRKPGPADHLAREPRQAGDGPFEGALTPRPRDGGVDGGQVRPEPVGEAPAGRQGARGGPSHPGVERGRLAPADAAGALLRQGHRRGQRRGRRRQRRQRAGIVRRGAC